MRVRAAVRLKSPDPAAVSGLEALRRFMPDQAPERMLRYDLWVFEDASPGEVQRVMSVYPDIVNPNKQTAAVFDGPLPPLPEDGTLWVGVMVTDTASSFSETWTELLGRAGFRTGGVTAGVLWVLGYPAGTPPDEALQRAGAVAVARDRRHGLLANPVSQSVELLVRGTEPATSP